MLYFLWSFQYLLFFLLLLLLKLSFLSFLQDVFKVLFFVLLYRFHFLAILSFSHIFLLFFIRVIFLRWFTFFIISPFIIILRKQIHKIKTILFNKLPHPSMQFLQINKIISLRNPLYYFPLFPLIYYLKIIIPTKLIIIIFA